MSGNGIESKYTKLKVYKALVLPTLLYAYEIWTVYQRLKLPQKTPKIRLQDKILDTEVLKKANMQMVHPLLKLAQLRWTGHATRMPDERLPRNFFLLRLAGRKVLIMWPKVMLQRHP